MRPFPSASAESELNPNGPLEIPKDHAFDGVLVSTDPRVDLKQTVEFDAKIRWAHVSFKVHLIQKSIRILIDDNEFNSGRFSTTRASAVARSASASRTSSLSSPRLRTSRFLAP